MKPTITTITQKMIFSYTKKLLMAVFSIVIFMASHAQIFPVGQSAIAQQEINNSLAFENVEITGEVTVVLTNSQSRSIMLQGTSKDISVVKTTEKDRTVEINAERKKTASRLIVYLPVAKMHSLRVTGKRIFSSGDIKVDDLEIILNGNAMVKVYCYGNLKVKPAEGYELGD
jgi:hypothetical protein